MKPYFSPSHSIDMSFNVDTLSGAKDALEVTGGYDDWEGRRKSSWSAWRSVAWRGFARSVELRQASSEYTSGENIMDLEDLL